MDIVTYALLNGKIKNYASNVDEWLEENVDPDTGYVLDRSLQMENAAAPADMVGDISDTVSDVKNTLNHKADVIYDTASGDIASFPDGADGLPVKDLTVAIEPVQDLHGYDNPWPAGGGKNKFDKSTQHTGGYLDDNGAVVQSSSWSYSDYIETGASQNVCISGYANQGISPRSCWYDDNKDFISAFQLSVPPYSAVTSPATAKYLRISAQSVSLDTVQVELGVTTPSTYSPYSNICPIAGWTGCNLAVNGENFCPTLIAETKNGQTLVQNVDGTVTLNGTFSKTSNNTIGGVTCILPAGSYILTGNESGGQDYALDAFFDNANHKDIGGGNSFTLSKETEVRIRIYINYSASLPTANNLVFKPMIRLSTVSDATFAPYSGTLIPISWQSEAGTVYGGTLDVTSGVLTVTDSLWTKNTSTMNNGENYPGWRAAGIAELIGTGYNNQFDTVMNIGTKYNVNTKNGNDILFFDTIDYGKTQTEWQALAIDVQMVVELAQPQTYQLTPQEVTTLLGQNNIWADCGPSTVEYQADTKLYIQKINTPTDDDMIADANIASGQYFIVNNNLYISTAAILAGDPIKPGTNCTLTNLAAALNAINS